MTLIKNGKIAPIVPFRLRLLSGLSERKIKALGKRRGMYKTHRITTTRRTIRTMRKKIDTKWMSVSTLYWCRAVRGKPHFKTRYKRWQFFDLQFH